jgi:hypothetical protein
VPDKTGSTAGAAALAFTLLISSGGFAFVLARSTDGGIGRYPVVNQEPEAGIVHYNHHDFHDHLYSMINGSGSSQHLEGDKPSTFIHHHARQGNMLWEIAGQEEQQHTPAVDTSPFPENARNQISENRS